jgi:hypothetical protein
MKIKKIIVEPQLGELLDSTADSMVKLSRYHKCKVVVKNFNGVKLTCTPHMLVVDVVNLYYKKLK